MTPRVFIVGAPRSGAGLLHATWLLDSSWSPSSLSRANHVDALPGLRLAERGFTSHRLTSADLTPELSDVLRRDADAFEAGDEDAERGGVDWNPRLSLRIPALAEVFPDARFVLVLRDPRPAVASLMQAWRSGRFVTVPELPDWWGESWSFPLIEGWRDLIGKPLAEVAAAQWSATAATCVSDLEALPRDRWTVTTLEALVDRPSQELSRITSGIGVHWKAEVPDRLPMSPLSSGTHDPARWHRQAAEVLPALNAFSDRLAIVRDFREKQGLGEVDFADEVAATPRTTRQTLASAGTPFSSAHSPSVVELLAKSGSSLVITTYKSGHAIIARSDGATLDTAFKAFNRPMGVAVAGSRLAVGTGDAIVSFSNQPGLTHALDGADATVTHDAAFMPRSVTFTGDVAIHEMAFDSAGDLWFVNTRFSCLCRQDLAHSFVPVWRPAWVTALAGEDRCHLNGLAMVDGRPRYVTALSRTDTPHSWREHKGTSGVIVDIDDDRVVAEGLSMPHSPRWHAGRLWVLESGRGALITVDVSTGHRSVVAELPGFTRGLCFLGPYAFVGLSQVRESVFKDLPVTASSKERNAGVWVIDTRTGQTVGRLRFDGVVQEIFDVQMLRGMRWPQFLDDSELAQNAFVLPTEALAQVASSE